MKIFRWMIPVCIATLVPMVAFGTELSDIKNIFQAVDFIEDAIHFEDITIKSAVPYEAVQDAIQKYCPKSAVDQAKKEAIPLNEVWSDYLNKPNINKSLSDRFDMVKGLISELKQDNTYKYCKDSYLLFSILKTTQDLYSGEKEAKTKKVVSTQNKVTNTQNVQTSAKQEKSETVTMHGVAYDRMYFTFVHDTAWLPKEARESFYQTTDKYLHDIMIDLVNIGILDDNDLKTMNYKIKVTYQQSCEVTEWAFRVMRNKQTWKVTFKEIELIIAYCDKNNTPERQKRHVQQILAHELGHYIYFFKDENPSKFSEICWDNGKMNCLPQDFVSNYAKKSKEEDYAESFAYWYLYSADGSSSDDKHGSAPDNPINRRARYFEELFEKEDDEDDDDEDEKE